MRLRFVLLCLLLAASEQALCAEPLEVRFAAGLRERGLFELAEQYCSERLSRLGPGDARRADLTVELVRTLAQQAVQAEPTERGAWWTKARAAAADFLKTSHPRQMLVRLQDALTPLAAGELARQEWEAGALAADRLPPALAALREATGLLEAIDQELAREIPLRRRAARSPGELTADELFSLRQQVGQQLARAQRNRALVAERGSADQTALLLAAALTFERPLAQLAEGEPLWSALKLELAECQRLLGNLDEAKAIAGAVLRAASADEVRQGASAELIRVAIARSDLAALQQLIAARSSTGEYSAPELELARFEALLALSRGWNEPAAAADYQDQAARSARRLEEKHGAYWGRRAGQLLAATLPRGATSADLLRRKADSLYLAGDMAQALTAYDAAAAKARERGDETAAFELAYKAALVEQESRQHEAAALRLRSLAKASAGHEQAARAHLLAAWNLARADAPGDYEEVLREQLATWPDAPTADEARLWLGQWRQSRGAWSAAIEAYAGVSRASTHFAAAVNALRQSWRQRLAALAMENRATDEEARQAIRWFREALAAPDPASAAAPAEGQQAAALAAAELIVAWQPGSASDAEAILREALARWPDASAWRTAAQAQLVVALAAQGGGQQEALRLVDEIAAASPSQMLGVLDALSQLAAGSSGRARASIARVQLAAVDRAISRAGAPAAEERLELNRIRAASLAAAGSRDEALVAYAELARSQPARGDIQEGYAEVLLAGSEAAELKQALDQWRIVASRSRPRSERWYKAKYAVAQAQLKLGDRVAAATLLRYLLESPPGLGGTPWEGSYRELLQKCGE